MTNQHEIERLASAVLTEALIDDPFYAAITIDFENDAVARRAALTDYFHYSLREGYHIGTVTLDAHGAAIWTLPQSIEARHLQPCSARAVLPTIERSSTSWNRLRIPLCLRGVGTCRFWAWPRRNRVGD